jgi:Fic family protein
METDMQTDMKASAQPEGKTPKVGRPKQTAIFEQFVAVQDELQKYGGLPSLDKAADIWDEIWMVEAHNSTGLEGNTLTLREVRTLLEANKASGGEKLREYIEVLCYANAAKWVYSQARMPSMISGEIITLTEIRHIHEQLVRLVWEVDPPKQLLQNEGPGSFRQHDIKRFSEGMQPPGFTLVPPMMDEWLSTTNEQIKAAYADELPLVLAKIHNRFEQIHPFRDGNGRCGRLALNLILVRLGFPPCIILKTRRAQYLKALQTADNGSCKRLAEIIARGVIDNIHRFIIPSAMNDKSLVRLESLVTKECSYSMLRQAALRGRLQAKLGSDGKYYSSQEALSEYQKSKYRR